jgi:hypothetical protein
MAEVKITKKERFNIIKDQLAGVDGAEDSIAFCDEQIAYLEAQAAKAAERREKKAKESDEIRALVLSKVTDEPKTGAQIAEEIDDEEISKNKVVARLTQLVKAGEVVKTEAKIEGVKGKTSTYTLA